jgi:hypothetical protein
MMSEPVDEQQPPVKKKAKVDPGPVFNFDSTAGPPTTITKETETPADFVMGMQTTTTSQGDEGSGNKVDAMETNDFEESKKIMLKLLVQVGSDAKVQRDVVASQQLPALADAIAGDVEDGLGEYICSTLLSCVVGFPHKFDIYAGLLGCINEEDGEFSEQIVQATMLTMENALESGATRDFKVLLRFFVLWPTVKICTIKDMFQSLEMLVDHVKAALSALPDDPKIQNAADEVIGAVVFALMCGGKALLGDNVNGEGKTLMENLLRKINQEYMTDTRRHQSHQNPLETIYPDAPNLRDCDALENIVACLVATINNSFDNAMLAERSYNVVKLCNETLEEAEPMDIPKWTNRVASVSDWSPINTKSCTREVRLFGDGGRSSTDFSWGESYRTKTLSKLSVSFF